LNKKIDFFNDLLNKNKFILASIFGDSVRIKILEILLDNALQKEIKGLNISEIAKLTGISTSSSKRIIDNLIEEKIVELNPLYIQTHVKNPEKEIKLNVNNKMINELIFFYRKLKGFV